MNRFDFLGLDGMGLPPDLSIDPSITTEGCAWAIFDEVEDKYCTTEAKEKYLDGSCRLAHCIANCRITRECFMGRLAAWFGSWYKEHFMGFYDPNDSPGDNIANARGRSLACKKGKTCEELCLQALPELRNAK